MSELHIYHWEGASAWGPSQSMSSNSSQLKSKKQKKKEKTNFAKENRCWIKHLTLYYINNFCINYKLINWFKFLTRYFILKVSLLFALTEIIHSFATRNLVSVPASQRLANLWCSGLIASIEVSKYNLKDRKKQNKSDRPIFISGLTLKRLG